MIGTTWRGRGKWHETAGKWDEGRSWSALFFKRREFGYYCEDWQGNGILWGSRVKASALCLRRIFDCCVGFGWGTLDWTEKPVKMLPFLDRATSCVIGGGFQAGGCGSCRCWARSEWWEGTRCCCLKWGSLCEGLSRPEKSCSPLLLSKAQSCFQIGAGSCRLTRNGEREPTPSQADRKELKLHGTPSVRICSLPGWGVQTRPSICPAVSVHALEWPCHSQLVLCWLTQYLDLPKSVQTPSVLEADILVHASKGLQGPGQGTARHPCRQCRATKENRPGCVAQGPLGLGKQNKCTYMRMQIFGSYTISHSHVGSRKSSEMGWGCGMRVLISLLTKTSACASSLLCFTFGPQA